MNIFNVEKQDIQKLVKFMHDYPKDIRFGTASVLNTLGFKTRDLNIKNLSESMTIRNLTFVKRMLRVDKAIPSHNIGSQFVTIGSVKSANFSGWKEQETGATPKKKTAPTLAARGGNIKNKVIGKYRFRKKNKNFYRPDQFSGKTPTIKYYHMMRILNEKGGDLTFLLRNPIPIKKGIMQKGLYLLSDKKIYKLQKIGDLKQPKKNQWMSRSVSGLDNNMSDAWNEYYKHHEEILKRKMPR